jgi:hypothetical protein
VKLILSRKKKFKKLTPKILIIIITIIILGGYFFISSLIGNPKYSNLKSLLNVEQKELIKKYIFPYKLISEQEQIISEQEQIISEQQEKLPPFISIVAELYKKESGSDIEIKHKKTVGEGIINLSNNLTLKKYKLMSGFYSGIWNNYPGSGYIDFYDKNTFILSARGILAFKKNLNDDRENFKQIRNNFNYFIDFEKK